MRRPVQIVLIALTIATGCAGAAQAQQYPNRPVRIVVGFAAGSGPDIIARAVGQQLGSDFGHNFYVENRLGANGTIAAKAVADAAPDGHSLHYTSSAISTTPYIYKKAGFDLLRDFAPIATVGILDGYLMMVNPTPPVRTVPEFIAYAKANRVLYGSPGVGNLLHLTAELFNVHTGLKMEHVPYRGVSEVVTALMQGSVHVMFVTALTSPCRWSKEGQLRAIGFNGTSRSRTCRMCRWSALRCRSFPPSAPGESSSRRRKRRCDRR